MQGLARGMERARAWFAAQVAGEGTERTWRAVRRTMVIGALATLAGCLAAGGCAPPSASTSKTNASEWSEKSTADESRGGAELSRRTAGEVRDKMLAAYRSARAYRDEAKIVLSYRQDGRPFTDEAPIRVRFERPNRLSVTAYQARLACDGQELRASIADPATNHVDGQFLVRPAPAALTLDSFLDDPLLEDQLGSGLLLPEAGRIPLPLGLLLAKSPPAILAGADVKLALAPPGTVDGHVCYRLEATNKQGTFRFWIDGQSFVVRKLEYPRAALVPRLANAADVRDVQFIAHFTNAELSERASGGDPEEFDLPTPPDAKQVRFFVPPPLPLPTDKFGQEIGSLGLTTPDGDKVTRKSLAGRIAALLWFSGHPECEPALAQFSQVRQQFAENSKLAFYAVATDPSTVSHQQLRDLLRGWKAQLPLARDLAAHGRDLLGIDRTPTLVLLNEKGQLQLYEVGVNPSLAKELPTVLEKLLAGEDVAAAVMRQAENEREEYERRLAIASSDEGMTRIDVPNVAVAEPQAPQKLRLKSLWKSESVANPGNLIVVPAPTDAKGQSTGAPRLFALSAGRKLVELGLETGEALATINLELALDESIQQIRSIADADGNSWYVGWTSGGRYLYAFGADGKRKWRYPPEDARHDGIRDVILADLDADRRPEFYVAFLGSAGLHSVTSDGERGWQVRSLGSVLGVALTAPNPVGWRRLLALSSRETVVQVNHFGNADPPLAISGWTLVGLKLGSDDPDLGPAYLGTGFDRQGKFGAVALNSRFAEEWSYPLLEGIWRTAVEPVQRADSGAGLPVRWLLASVDGRLHWIRGDGGFSDYWTLGFVPTGLAVVIAKPGEKFRVAVGSDVAVELFEVEEPAE